MLEVSATIEIEKNLYSVWCYYGLLVIVV